MDATYEGPGFASTEDWPEQWATMNIPLGPMVLLITTWLVQGLSGIVFSTN